MKSISLKSLVLFILRGSYVEAVVNYQLDVKGYENTDDDSDIDAVSCYCQMHFSIDNPVATLYHQNNHPCQNDYMHYAVVRRRTVTTVHDSAMPCKKTEYNTIPCNTIQYNEMTCNTMQ